MRQNRLKIIGIAIALTIIATGSVWADGWFEFVRGGERGSGDIVTEQREVSEFERIRLECSADVVISVGDEWSVTVTTDDNLQDYIITEVIRRKTLLIDSDGSYRSRRGVLVEITVPELTLLEVDGSGDVEITGLDSETFEIELDGSGDIAFDGKIDELGIELSGSGQIIADDITSQSITIESHGSGDIELRGRTESLDISMHGSGDINARRLRASDAVVRIHGSGDADIYADTEFDGSVYGSGDINVYGDPKYLDRHVSGSGDISRR